MADNLRLVIMTFPQRWEPAASTLHVNALLVPTVSPLDDPLVGAAPAFADRIPSFGAVVIGSLDVVPKTADAQAIGIAPVIVEPSPPIVTRTNYEKLVAQAAAQGVTVAGTGALPGPSASTIRKALPQSYLDATGARAGGDTATTDDFGCAIRGQQVFKPGAPVKTIGWGPTISYALRQPMLATALGLRYRMRVTLPAGQTDALAAGGWIFVTLEAGDTWAAAAVPGQIRIYAARLPALSAPRQVFAPVIFPVDAVAAIDDNAFGVAETYDDGFAQIVHVHQPQANDAVVGDGSEIPAATDAGVQIGWDDEQVTAWQNGQIQILNDRLAGNLDAQTPLGVSGYRVDVADVTGKPAIPAWHSLVRADVVLPNGFGHFDGELTIEPTAVRPQDPAAPNTVSGDAWLPRYFANWRGGSLVSADSVPGAMLKGTPLKATPDPVGVLLSYGRSYAFRVRLADLTGGGPRVADAPANVDPADVAAIDFRRSLPPKKPSCETSIPAGATIPDAYTFYRPLIGYPEVLYTSLGDSDANRGAIVEFFTKNAKPGSGNVVGLPDPDAAKLELIVSVRSPLHDVAGDGVLDAPFRELYRTTRAFAALPAGPTPVDPGLRIDVAYLDAPSIVDWADAQPSHGPLLVPRGRDVRIVARALTRDDPAYFYPAATTGLTASISLRAESRREPSLLVRSIDGSAPVRGFLFKRYPGTDAPAVAVQLAQQLGIVADGLTLSAPPGRRIAFGASKGVRHTLSGDGSSITFASEAELLRQWIVPLVADLERDWTWDGLANAGAIAVERDGEVVGSLTVVRTLGAAAVADPANWDRRRTQIIFFDGVDPHEPTASGFPEALNHSWRLHASTVTDTGPPVGVTGTPKLKPGSIAEPAAPELNGAPQHLTLPIAIPPAQIPEIASVGLALSPYEAGPGYATTQPRSRALWIELAEPIANDSGDALFARVLAHGADPLLYNAVPSTDQAQEPPIALDPELMRVITPDESDDRAGLDAMLTLERASDSNVHFLLPLPPGVDPSSPELFGFYTYELRVGHAGDPHDRRWWSTARARYGRPLRVSGVQHPAPQLECRAGRFRDPGNPDKSRQATYVLATATYATPMLDGQPLVRQTEFPKTALFFFLYAQVVQADAASNRNVLLFQREGHFYERPRDVERSTQRDRLGSVLFTEAEIEDELASLGLPADAPISVLAAEFLPAGTPAAVAAGGDGNDPLGLDARPRRILRVSPLVQITAIC